MKTKLLSCCIVFMATLQLFAVNDFTIDGIGYVKLGGDSVEVGENSGITGDVVIPATVTNGAKTYRVVAIGSNAFSGTNITSVVLPESVRIIRNYAFRFCYSITSISLPNSLTYIGDAAFEETAITSITIPEGVVEMSGWTFYNCSNLASITLPSTLESVGPFVLYGTAINTPIYNQNVFIYLPSSFTGVYTIPEGISTIASSVFYEHIGLTGIILPQSLKSINYDAFYGCTNISSITIPANVERIDYNSFNGCVDLTDVYVEAKNPPYIGNNAFASDPTIHLVCGINEESYRNNWYWNEYVLEYPQTNFSLILSTDTTQGTIDTLRALACNNDTAVIYAQANAGYHFTSWSDGNTDNPRTIIMTQDKTLHANFAESLYTFTATTEDATKGTVSATNGTFQYGTTLVATANPAEHYTFDHWDIQLGSEEVISVNEAIQIASNLTPGEKTTQSYYIYGYITGNNRSYTNSYFIGSSPNGSDNFVIYKAQQSANVGDFVLVKSQIINYQGMYYETMEEATIQIIANSNQNPLSINIAGNTQLTAIFTKDQYQYCKVCHNCYIYSEFGTYQGRGNAGCHFIDYGTSIKLTVLPNEGYIFQQWSDGNTDNPRTFTITQDTTMEAICIRDQSVLTLNVSDDEAGRVFGAGTYDKNTSVQIFAIPNSGYDFVGWSDGNNMNPRYLYLDEAEKTLTANFEITSAAQYVVNVTSQNPEQGSVTTANYVRLDAIPANGCTFVRWSDGNTDNPRYMELNADIELQAIFEGVPSGIGNTPKSQQSTIRKVIVNDQIFILRDDKTYTLQGQEVK